MPLVDGFNSTVFNVVSLTESVNELPTKPTRLGAMGLFEEKGIKTTGVMIEEKNGQLALLPTVRRGGPATPHNRGNRTGRLLTCSHIPLSDEILADDLQNRRAFGSETNTESMTDVVNDTLQEMKDKIEVTREYHRVGAVHGSILDNDGTTEIYNLFTEFGVSETTVNFILGTATTEVIGKCQDVLNAVDDAIGGSYVYDHVHAICGRTWFASFITHDHVKEAYANWQSNAFLRSDPRAGFEFGGITWECYYGSVSSVNFINTSQARAFPVGARGLFREYFAPATYADAVNTVGLPFYASKENLPHNKGVSIEVQSNPLPICHMPAALIKITTS